tara:strand:+ start:950 stop:1087 length:138 start_codon:yes stop_codon:yes gene_type:complete
MNTKKNKKVKSTKKSNNKVARVYKSKNSRVKNALAFKTKRKTKLA